MLFSKIFQWIFLSFCILTAATEYQLFYTSPATTWKDQCLPIGNGKIGGMLYGGVATDHIQFNDITLWKGGSTTEGTGSYLGFGDLFVDVSSSSTSSTNYRRDLDIGEAVSHVTYAIGNTSFKREYFCSLPDSVMIAHYTTNTAGALSLTARITPLTGLTSTAVVALGNTITFSGYQNSGADLTRLNFEAQVYVKNYGGTVSVSGANIKVTNADSVDLIFAAATDYKQSSSSNWRGTSPHDIVSSHITNAVAKSYNSIREAHIADYQNIFNRFSLDLNDSISKGTPTNTRRASYQVDAGKDRGLEVLFMQYGRYLIISSSRNSLPANLQGLWNDALAPQWKSDYHSDINITMNYSHVLPLNVSECLLPFINFVDAQRAVRHTRTAAQYPGVRGWTVQTETNPMGGTSWEWNNPSSAWYCNLLWDNFQFNLDTSYLRTRALPIMKEVCQFWQDHLVMKNGKLVSPDGWSPENGKGGDYTYREAGTAYDQQVVWDLFTNYSKAEGICNTDPVFHHVVDSLLTKLDNGIQIAAGGYIKEWPSDVAGENNHRHLSHLYCLYPGFQVSPYINTTNSNAAKQALTLRGDGSTGWSCAWRADCWARLLDGTKAYHQIGLQIKNYVYGNLLDNCNDVFQIDGNCGTPSAIAEMLLQSQNGEIAFLPALPVTWPKGSVKGMQARGAFTIEMMWANSKLTGATILSNKGATCQLRLPQNATSITCDGKDVATTAVGSTSLTFSTVAGKTYVVNGGTVSMHIHSVKNKTENPTFSITGNSLHAGVYNGVIDKLEIMNMNGQTVFAKSINKSNLDMELSTNGNHLFKNGAYILRIKSSGHTYLKTFTIFR